MSDRLMLPIQAIRKDVLGQIPQQPFKATVKAINLVKGAVQLQIGGSSAWQWYRCLANVGLDHVSVEQEAVVSIFSGEPVVVGFLWTGGKERKVPAHDHSNAAEGDQDLRRILEFELQDPVELTIDTGEITRTQAYHTVDTEGDAAADNLDTINGGATGDMLVLQAAHDARTPTIKHNVDNIWMTGGGDIALNDINDIAILFYNGTMWCCPN